MSSEGQFPYIHGFSKEEQKRLREQAEFKEHQIFGNLNLLDLKNLLEVGCGVGAQTEILLRRYPKIEVTGIDLNERQIQSAQDHLKNLQQYKGRYNIQKMDAVKMNFNSDHFDGAFLTWVLEHVPEPLTVLNEVHRVLKPGGMVIINEVMNFTFFIDPYSPSVWKYWMAFNDHQWENFGDPFIGGKLGHLLNKAGFRDIRTTTKVIHFDSRHPVQRKKAIQDWRELCLSAKDALLEAGKVDSELIDKVEEEFDRVESDPDSIFYDTFMQAIAYAE